MRPKARPKKEVVKKEEKTETGSNDDDDASSGSGTDMRDISYSQSTNVTA